MRILGRLLNSSIRGGALEDFEEELRAVSLKRGKFPARLWLWLQIAAIAPSYIVDRTYWSLVMFKNYITITLRNIIRHKGYSFINIAGLALGMSCCLLITLWVLDELSFDRFHENAANLYRVEQEQLYSGEPYHVNVTPYPMGPALKTDIPEVADATRYVRTGGMLVRYGEKAFFENAIWGVDPSFLTMFTFPLKFGDKNSALSDPLSIVVTEEMAEKYFGGENPVGKVLSINNRFDVTVTAVAENVPDNSYFSFDMLLPYELLRMAGRTNENWGSNSIVTFIQLHPNSLIADVNEKMSVLRHKYVATLIEESYPDFLEEWSSRPRVEFMVRPLTDLRLHAYFGFGKPMGAIQYVYIFSTIALFVLLIACINFMNLSTARSANRAREVGMRKVVGALKKQLVAQFYGESVIFACIALAIALIIVSLLLPTFNTLSGKEITADQLASWKIVVSMIAITLITGVVAGSYPALFLSRFKPATVLKGAVRSGVKSSAFRKTLVVVQFTLSIFLIIGTFVVYNQIGFMRNKQVGYDKEHLMYIRLRGDMRSSYSTLKKELVNDPRILGVTGCFQLPTYNSSNSGGADWDGKDPEESVLIGTNNVDFDFTETMKIEMKEGRSFSYDFPSDTSTAFLVNEKVADLMGKESVVGERFSFIGVDGTIIGVMKNFHFKPVRDQIEPLALVIAPNNINYVLIRITPGDITASVDYVKSTWERVIPDYPFEYSFLDSLFDRMYRTEQRMGDLLKNFSVLAVLIACLGLFGLASFTAEQRTKEIGIRKVLGATAPGITMLLCREFLKLIIVSNLVAWPAAWFILNNWLQDFAYRTNLGVNVFVLTGILTLLVALITVSFQAVRAALLNPVNSLKYE